MNIYNFFLAWSWHSFRWPSFWVSVLFLFSSFFQFLSLYGSLHWRCYRLIKIIFWTKWFNIFQRANEGNHSKSKSIERLIWEQRQSSRPLRNCNMCIFRYSFVEHKESVFFFDTFHVVSSRYTWHQIEIKNTPQEKLMTNKNAKMKT